MYCRIYEGYENLHIQIIKTCTFTAGKIITLDLQICNKIIPKQHLTLLINNLAS